MTILTILKNSLVGTKKKAYQLKRNPDCIKLSIRTSEKEEFDEIEIFITDVVYTPYEDESGDFFEIIFKEGSAVIPTN